MPSSSPLTILPFRFTKEQRRQWAARKLAEERHEKLINTCTCHKGFCWKHTRVG